MNIWVCISYSVNSNAHTKPVRIYGEPYAHKFCAVDFFWNITHRQAISPVAKFHHVLGRDFLIHRVILIFIKCLSANQNQLFYMKVLIFSLNTSAFCHHDVNLEIYWLGVTTKFTTCQVVNFVLTPYIKLNLQHENILKIHFKF